MPSWTGEIWYPRDSLAVLQWCFDCIRLRGMSAEPLLMAYFRALDAQGWVQVPTTRETGQIIFVRGTHLLDRIKVARHRWSHQLFDGASWQEMARGDDAASLAKYITEHFRSRGR